MRHTVTLSKFVNNLSTPSLKCDFLWVSNSAIKSGHKFQSKFYQRALSTLHVAVSQPLEAACNPQSDVCTLWGQLSTYQLNGTYVFQHIPIFWLSPHNAVQQLAQHCFTKSYFCIKRQNNKLRRRPWQKGRWFLFIRCLTENKGVMLYMAQFTRDSTEQRNPFVRCEEKATASETEENWPLRVFVTMCPYIPFLSTKILFSSCQQEVGECRWVFGVNKLWKPLEKKWFFFMACFRLGFF